MSQAELTEATAAALSEGEFKGRVLLQLQLIQKRLDGLNCAEHGAMIAKVGAAADVAERTARRAMWICVMLCLPLLLAVGVAFIQHMANTAKMSMSTANRLQLEQFIEQHLPKTPHERTDVP